MFSMDSFVVRDTMTHDVFPVLEALDYLQNVASQSTAQYSALQPDVLSLLPRELQRAAHRVLTASLELQRQLQQWKDLWASSLSCRTATSKETTNVLDQREGLKFHFYDEDDSDREPLFDDDDTIAAVDFGCTASSCWHCPATTEQEQQQQHLKTLLSSQTFATILPKPTTSEMALVTRKHSFSRHSPQRDALVKCRKMNSTADVGNVTVRLNPSHVHDPTCFVAARKPTRETTIPSPSSGGTFEDVFDDYDSDMEEDLGSRDDPLSHHNPVLSTNCRYRTNRSQELKKRLYVFNSSATEKILLGLSLCVPFLTPQERVCKLAPLCRDCYHSAMSGFPIVSVDFCDPDTDDDLMWLPAFVRHLVPTLSKTLQSARINCTEHGLLIGAVGTPLRELSLSNVPASMGGSSLLSAQLRDATKAAGILLNSTSTRGQLCGASSTLAPLRPLAGWLHAIGCRCYNLRFFSVQFNPELPFSVSCGLPSHQVLPPQLTVASRTYDSALLSSSTRTASRFFRHLASYLSRRQSGTNATLQAAQLPDLVDLVDPCPMAFRHLTTLEILQVASPLPLTLLFGIAFPKLQSLVIATTAAFSTTSLAEFLTVFGILSIQRCQPVRMLENLIIQHASNIANTRLLESLSVFQGLRSLQLLSNAAFGSHVRIYHPTVEHLEISFHPQLLWTFELPHLQCLKLCVPTCDLDEMFLNDLQFSDLSATLFSKCADLHDIQLVGPNRKVLLHLQGRDAIRATIPSVSETYA